MFETLAFIPRLRGHQCPEPCPSLMHSKQLQTSALPNTPARVSQPPHHCLHPIPLPFASKACTEGNVQALSVPSMGSDRSKYQGMQIFTRRQETTFPPEVPSPPFGINLQRAGSLSASFSSWCFPQIQEGIWHLMHAQGVLVG